MNASGKLRLLHLREQTEAVEETMADERARFARIRGAEPTRAVTADQLFQTPPVIAADMAALLCSLLGERAASAVWLEPSAGLGRLYRAGRAAGLKGPCTLVEQSPDCAAGLYALTEGDPAAMLRVGDFLALPWGSEYDAILMNPPFRRGTDIRHILHARTMLRPSGVLVGLCYDGVQQRRRLRPIADRWEPLPPGTFRAEGTGAGAVLFVLGEKLDRRIDSADCTCSLYAAAGTGSSMSRTSRSSDTAWSSSSEPRPGTPPKEQQTMTLTQHVIYADGDDAWWDPATACLDGQAAPRKLDGTFWLWAEGLTWECLIFRDGRLVGWTDESTQDAHDAANDRLAHCRPTAHQHRVDGTLARCILTVAADWHGVPVYDGVVTTAQA